VNIRGLFLRFTALPQFEEQNIFTLSIENFFPCSLRIKKVNQSHYRPGAAQRVPGS